MVKNAPVTWYHKIKFLCVTIGRRLNFGINFNETVKKATSIWGMLYPMLNWKVRCQYMATHDVRNTNLHRSHMDTEHTQNTLETIRSRPDDRPEDDNENA